MNTLHELLPSIIALLGGAGVASVVVAIIKIRDPKNLAEAKQLNIASEGSVADQWQKLYNLATQRLDDLQKTYDKRLDDMENKYVAALQEKDAEIAKLQDGNEKLMRSNTKLQKQVDDLGVEVADLRNKLKKYETATA